MRRVVTYGYAKLLAVVQSHYPSNPSSRALKFSNLGVQASICKVRKFFESKRKGSVRRRSAYLISSLDSTLLLRNLPEKQQFRTKLKSTSSIHVTYKYANYQFIHILMKIYIICNLCSLNDHRTSSSIFLSSSLLFFFFEREKIRFMEWYVILAFSVRFFLSKDIRIFCEV